MKLFVLLVTALFGAAPAMAAGFDVSVTESRSGIAVRFKTIDDHSSMCHLDVKSITINEAMKPHEDSHLSFETYLDPSAACLTAIGPHSGTLILERGTQVPKVRQGNYILTVDGTEVGTLVIDKTSAVLK